MVCSKILASTFNHCRCIRPYLSSSVILFHLEKSDGTMCKSQAVIINLENDVNHWAIGWRTQIHKMYYIRSTFDNYTQNYKHSLWHFICLCPSFMLLNYVSHRYHWNTSEFFFSVFFILESHIMYKIVLWKDKKKHDQQWKQNFIARSKNASNSWVISVSANKCA